MPKFDPAVHRLLRAAVLLLLNLTASAATPGPGELPVAVRSGVDLAVRSREQRAASLRDPARPKPSYMVLSVKEAPSLKKFVAPVDARAIAEKLAQVLDARGFRHAQAGQSPDILVGAEFCRGYLPNPYTYKLGRNEQRALLIDNLTDRDSLVAHPPLFEPLPGLQEKAQRASLEKLIIIVVAWKYPPPADPKEIPKPLWRTTLSVDDPDHLDLNGVAPAMLEAGAPFFDRELTEPEVVVAQPLPEGRVKLGAPVIIDDGKTAPK